MSDRLIDAAKETAGMRSSAAKQVAHDATEATKESGKEEGHKLTTNLKQRVEQTGTGSQPATHPS